MMHSRTHRVCTASTAYHTTCVASVTVGCESDLETLSYKGDDTENKIECIPKDVCVCTRYVFRGDIGGTGA